MAVQALIPGVGFVEESQTVQALVPGAGYVNETVSSGTVVALTGLAATSEAGLLAVLHTQAIAGLEATSAVGTVTAATQTDVSVSLTGLAATVALGAFDVLRTHAVTGLAATSAAGSVTAARTHALAGLAATGAVGSITVARTHAVDGLEATADGGLVVPYATQLVWPTSDVSDGTWTPSTGADLYAMLDEATPDDGDYDTSTDPLADEFEVAFGALTDPSASTGHVIRYRIGAVDGICNFVVSLHDGATQIAAWPHPGLATMMTFEQTLAEVEADAISNYADLRLRFVATKVS